MIFDPSLPIAVFLGPSLDEDSARALLPANYYPPVRMGDVYRLIASGVRLIVIIDGVFHKTTPVWQREIVSAIESGITVVGAASMGALRAVELAPFGMIGAGTVVDWYRSGRIEGDDEVALQHADRDFNYRALSEPLVNIRWNLDRAVGALIIDDAQRHALAGAIQAIDYTRRSYHALYETAAFLALPAETRVSLERFIRDHAQDLKRMDATAALEWCAARLPQLLDGRDEPDKPPAIERADELLLRGVPDRERTLVAVKDLLPRLSADRSMVAGIVQHAARRFYMLEWAARAGVKFPDGVAAAFEKQWAEGYAVTDRDRWCSANGITEAELARELEARARVEWLLERKPEGVGLDRPFLEAWAEEWGITPPPGREDSRDFREWLIACTPAYFGFVRWSPDIAFVRELQLTGAIARAAQESAHARAV